MKNDQNTSESMGARIRAAREEQGLSQLRLAQKLNFQSATAVSLIESGERGVSSELLHLLAKALDRDVQYFLGLKQGKAVNLRAALRADKDLTPQDKKALLLFIELAKSRKNGRRSA